MILLIKNGHVINPATETDEVADILAEDGKVVKMEKNIKAKADRVIDAKGCYVMPGFIDMHVHLRDPGQEQKETIEKKLEIDRRLIKDRIAQLNRELKEVRQHRDITRAQREKNQMPVAAIVGYTNAGKSTLINTLTNAGVLEEDKLFATLDPTTRVLELSGQQQILVTDTVGFIRKLPHHLIEAFKSTLEEAKYADYILHVVDASNPQHEKQMLIVYETLANLDVKDKTVITLFNKQDARMDSEPLHDFKADHTLPISAKNGTGLEELKNLLSELLRENKILVERTVPYANAGVIQLVRKSGELLEEEYREDGIYIRAYVPMEIYAKL